MVIGIIISLFLLMLLAYRGFSVIVFAPLCAILAALTAGWPILPTYTDVFMAKGVVFIKNFFPLFLLGALFGKIMEASGAARSIARAIADKLGPDKAILATTLAAGVLSYGGVSVFVVAFAVYPFAAVLFRTAGIPKRLIPGTLTLGMFTFPMTAFPGTPQLQNIIPTRYFGTTTFAAPVLGIVVGILMLVLGILWLEWRKRKLLAAGEGYGEGHINEPDPGAEQSEMNPILALLPMIVVLGLNLYLTNAIPNWEKPTQEIFAGVSMKGSAAIWALIVAIFAGCVVAIAIGFKNMKTVSNISTALSAGAIGSLLTIMNTATEVGYGSVVSSLPGFKTVSDFLMSIDPGTPLISEALTVNILAGITGSASGGMAIALEAMGAHYLEWANSIGLDPEVLHRIASLASGGLDSLPHNGAVISVLAICGLTHRQSYADVGMCSVVIPVFLNFAVIPIYSLGIL
ncbi:MAG: GntP family permease [Deltaproteobacteria bacterium]|jgi:H+/gluconate symporter-like permease|nr:GntP family permease [Deltaproteobacteria bacterium]